MRRGNQPPYAVRALACGALFLFALGVTGTFGCRGDSRGDGNSSVDADAAEEGGDSGRSALQGAVQIDGSSTVYPICEAMASAFGEPYPNVKVTVGESGTGGGFKRFVRGETDISNASRPIKWEEHRQCGAAQPPVQYVELPIAFDGLTIVVHRENDWVDRLTVDQLRSVFLEGGAAKWNEVNPAWPAAKIQVYAPGADSGTYDFFKEVMEGGNGAQAMRADASTSEDDNVLVTGVAGDPNAIGFFGASYFFNNRDKLKAVPIVNPATNQAVAPSHATVLDGSYAPFSRPLFIYLNVDSLKRPEVQRFAKFFLEHAAELAEKVDYVGLPDDVATRAAEHLQKKTAGTHFWTPAGERRSGALTDAYLEANAVQAGG